MSPKLPAVNGKQVIARRPRKEGWYVKRVRGSHHVLRHPSIPERFQHGRIYVRSQGVRYSV